MPSWHAGSRRARTSDTEPRPISSTQRERSLRPARFRRSQWRQPGSDTHDAPEPPPRPPPSPAETAPDLSNIATLVYRPTRPSRADRRPSSGTASSESGQTSAFGRPDRAPRDLHSRSPHPGGRHPGRCPGPPPGAGDWPFQRKGDAERIALVGVGIAVIERVLRWCDR